MKRRLLLAALILLAWMAWFTWQRQAIDQAVGAVSPAVPARA